MIRLSLLGAVEIDGTLEGGGGLSAHTRRLALLAYLVLKRPRGYVRRDALLPLFWPDLDQVHAQKALRQAIYVLRQNVCADVVENRGGDEIGVPPGCLWCDAVAFEEELGEGRAGEALELYRGDLLPGFHLTGAPDFIDWLDRERQRLCVLAVDAARQMAEASTRSGDLDAAIRWARKWLALSPDDEQAAEEATRLLAQAGDRTGALKLYEEFKERLARDFDIVPSPAMADLAQAVREGKVSARRQPQVPPADAVPSGMVDVSPSPPARRPARTTWLAAGAGIAAVTVAGFIWMNAEVAQRAGAGAGEIAVAVLPFSVQGDPSFAYLEEGMVDLLSMSLSGAGSFRTVDPATLLAAVGDQTLPLELASAAQVAKGVGAELFVLGSVVEAAGRVRVSARLYDRLFQVQGVAEGTAEEEGQLFQLVDLVARDLLATRYASPELRLREVAARTTTSLPALKAYLAAERASRIDRPAEALAEARRAVILDPGFALAHFRLSTAAAWMNQPRLALETARDAMKYSDELGPRDQTLLRAHLDQQERRFQAAIDGYRAVVSEQPDHVEGWFKLGEAFFHANPAIGRSIQEADEPLVRTLTLDPGNVPAALHRARLAAIRGEAAVVDSILAMVRGVGATAESELEIMSLRAALRPEAEGAVVDAFTSGRPAAELNAAIWSRATFGGDVVGAARLARVALGAVTSLEWQAVFRVHLAHLALAQGRWAEAWNELTRAESLDPSYALEEKGLMVVMPFLPPRTTELEEVRRKLEAWAPVDSPTLLAGRAARAGLRDHLRLYLLGLVQARAGNPSEARATADMLATMPGPAWPEELVESWVRGIRAFAYHAEGRDEEARLLLVADGEGPWGFGNPPGMTQSPERYLWATIEAARGNAETARAAFNSFAYRRLYHVPFVAPSALQRARLEAQEGRVDEARTAYRIFLESWSRSDEVFRPLVNEALEELAALEALAR